MDSHIIIRPLAAFDPELIAAAKRASNVGIGVGMGADYGAAQRLYVRLGYVPDGRGVTYAALPVKRGDRVVVDDDLVLYLTKRLD